MCVEEFTYLRGRTDGAGQGDADQRAAGGRLLRSRQVARRLRDARRLSRRPRRLHARARSPSWCGSAASTSRSTRRSTPALLDETIREGYRQRGSDPDKLLDALHRARQRDHRRPPGRHLRHPHLPRQPQEHVLRVGRLRPHRRAGLQPRAASIASCSSTTTSGRGRSSRCGTCPTIASSCSAWSARRSRALESRGRAASAHRGGVARSCRSSGWRSARSAASPRRTKATGSRADDQRRKLELVGGTARDGLGMMSTSAYHAALWRLAKSPILQRRHRSSGA